MAAPDPTNEPLYDLGILFVHGIGQSAKAETLLGFGEHLRKCIERLTTDTADVQSRVSIENAKLDPEPGEGPARADLRISNTGRESRWLMAEAWWAGVFPPPAADEIVRWGFKVLPWTLMAHFDRRLRRMGFRTCRAFDGLHPFTEGLPFLLGWAVEAVNVVLALAALPFLMVLLAALWLLGLVPFTPVRDFVRSVQKTLAETIGDSFMLVDQPIVTSAIVGCVREKLEWLAARSRRVAIVAHSQGAAIAHMVLRAPLTAPCDLLITFGSGLAKVSEIKQARDANARRFVLLGMAGATLASACLLLNVVEPWRPFSIWNALTGLLQAVIPVELGVILAFFDLFLTNLDQQSEHEPAPPSWSYVLLYVLPICAFIALVERSWTAWPHVLLNGGFAAGLGIAYLSVRRWQAACGRSLHTGTQWRRDRDVYRTDFQLRNRPYLNWRDVYATADPVPNGPLLDDFPSPPKLFTYKVSNAHSTLLDHTTYWQNEDEFVQGVARELMRLVGVSQTSQTNSHVGARRRWRVGWRVTIRFALAIAAAAVLWRWQVQPPVWLVSWIPIDKDAGFPLSQFRNHAERQSVVLLALLWAAAGWSSLWAWNGWNKHESDRAFTSKDFELAGGRFLLFVAVLWAWVTSGLFVATGITAIYAMCGLAAFAGVLVSYGPVRRRLNFQSASGPSTDLSKHWLARMERRAKLALKHDHKEELTQIGRELLESNADLATRVLKRAIEKRSPNAAWTLGLYFDRLERNTPGPVKKVELRREAKDAFAKGAALGDANCAWWLASKEREDENTDNALDYYQQALELGDAGSAHSIALLLEARGKHDEAEKVYRKGIDGEDALSAAFLAQRLWFKARDAETRDGETAAKLRNEATALYRRAFELGHVSAARDAGDLLRRSGNLQAARRAYLLGAKLRDAECAYQLGLLEEEEREDREAARNAYRLAIRWDDGAIAEKARYRLGALLEAEGRVRAASHLYRAAMGRAGTPVGVPEAAVAFGRYLHKRGERDKAKEAFERGMELDPRAAAPSYIEFLESTYDHDTAAALPIDQSTGLSHADLLRLARLLRYQHAPRAKELLQLAVRAKSADAVIQLHSMLDSHEQKALLQQVSEMDVWFVEHVARLLEENHETYAARELRSLLQPEKPVAEAGAD